MALAVVRGCGKEELAVNLHTVRRGEDDLLWDDEFVCGVICGDEVGCEVAEFSVGCDERRTDGDAGVCAQDCHASGGGDHGEDLDAVSCGDLLYRGFGVGGKLPDVAAIDVSLVGAEDEIGAVGADGYVFDFEFAGCEQGCCSAGDGDGVEGFPAIEL